jgi:hypothetical protein
MTRANLCAMVRFGVPGLCLGVFLAAALGIGGISRLQAQAQRMPDPGGSGTVAFTSSGPGNAQWLYLIDTRNQALAVYRVDPGNPKGTIKLEAARQYHWDLKLAEYNNLPPEVAAIQSMVQAVK